MVISFKRSFFGATFLLALFVACSSDGGTETVEVEQPATYSEVFLLTGGDGAVATQSFKVGTAQNLTANAFTRTGYTFSGWNTKSDGSGTTYEDGTHASNLSVMDRATT